MVEINELDDVDVDKWFVARGVLFFFGMIATFVLFPIFLGYYYGFIPSLYYTWMVWIFFLIWEAYFALGVVEVIIKESSKKTVLYKVIDFIFITIILVKSLGIL